MPLPEFVEESEAELAELAELDDEVLVEGVAGLLDVLSLAAAEDDGVADVPVAGVVSVDAADELDTPEINPTVSRPAAPAAIVPAMVALVCRRLLMT